jgi:huntingtin
MSSIDRLSKSFEALKIPVQLYDAEQRKQELKLLTKKDKINHLNLIYESIAMLGSRQTDDYSKMLSLVTETYLTFLDDEDMDVVFVAEEGLNKTIKALLDSNLTRFPADLYRFIRKNGPERSLKGALLRFSELCHLIKPHKCRLVNY